MIDCEVKVFNRVYPVAAPLCASKKFVSTVISEAPTAFPAASLIEIDNRTVRKRQGSTPAETYARVTYQLDVFATTKAKCREIYGAVDDAMIGMNFSRTSGQYIDNAENTQVFRYTSRYVAEVDPDGNLYRIS